MGLVAFAGKPQAASHPSRRHPGADRSSQIITRWVYIDCSDSSISSNDPPPLRLAAGTSVNLTRIPFDSSWTLDTTCSRERAAIGVAAPDLDRSGRWRRLATRTFM
jgi:hypothetical protein